ncbi:unnamed protein product [Cylicocyclus nassatus]|uniref:Uncharacterized protein n=1 Tax=Cylicocyclus nassatus TaxID=53992 RepID=A0AA36DSN8_CYLNA|nr:unnamed protein product [Cylicocyclus nassatus]
MTWGDAAFLANWYYSDEYPDYLKTETDVIKRTYKAAQDPDGYEGMTFARWLSDIIGKEIEIDWEHSGINAEYYLVTDETERLRTFVSEIITLILTNEMEALFNLGNLLTMLITALATWGGTFLFYKQEKRSKDIDNEAKQSEEWRKLYLDSQEDSRKKEEDSRKKDEKIDELRKEMSDMRRQMNNLERRVILNSIYRCNRVDCSNREPKPDETQRLSMEETNDQ